ncbi:MAG: 3-deoxy-D-manno-octulosonic acid kinase [Gammaproteobacteria bacterium]|nr:3-deoxy-D-manno-octulosonic acid kinase [Gammaproteobacteria bacterium]
MREATSSSGGEHILYDADATKRLDRAWFDPAALTARGKVTGSAGGRGRAQFFGQDGAQYVLRHYRRGGAVAALLEDRYLYTGLHRTRAWREWRLLVALAQRNLPVPRPFAARVVIAGALYRADLITYRLMNATPLSEVLARAPLAAATWAEIGRVIAMFHAARVWHADLNAHNVLVDSGGAVTLIDFDRARVRSPAARWRRDNLARLHLSLRKLKYLNAGLHFTESDFDALQTGYGSAA